MKNIQTPGMLDKIMASKAQEVDASKRQRSLADLLLEQHLQRAVPGRLEAAFLNRKTEPPLMLEIKPASPSAGVLAPTVNLETLLPIYEAYGSAISVLTDITYFGGSLDLLGKVRQATQLPVLRKDFIFDPYQIAEARLAGADAVLLIVKALTDEQLGELTAFTRQWGMTPLIEIQDEHELKRALAVEPSILLINNRDLQTLQMDMGTTSRLAPLVPKGVIRVSASGVESRTEIEQLKPYCDGFLIGSLLMRQETPALLEQTLKALLQ